MLKYTVINSLFRYEYRILYITVTASSDVTHFFEKKKVIVKFSKYGVSKMSGLLRRVVKGFESLEYEKNKQMAF